MPISPSGNDPDKISLSAGYPILESLFPVTLEGHFDDQFAGETEISHPAAAHPRSKVSARNPVSITLPFAKEREQPSVRTLNISGLTKTEWAKHNNEIQTSILAQEKAIKDECSRSEVLRLYQRLMEIINKILSARFTRGAKKGQAREARATGAVRLK